MPYDLQSQFKVNKTPPKHTLSAAYQKAFVVVVVFGRISLFTCLHVLYLKKSVRTWTEIDSLRHPPPPSPPPSPTFSDRARRALNFQSWHKSLKMEMAKKPADLCYPELRPAKAGPRMVQNLPLLFPDPPDTLIPLILKATKLILLSNTGLPSSPFWIGGCLWPLPAPRNSRFRVDRPAVISGSTWRHVHVSQAISSRWKQHVPAEYVYYNIKWLRLFILWTSWFSVPSVHLNLASLKTCLECSDSLQRVTVRGRRIKQNEPWIKGPLGVTLSISASLMWATAFPGAL